MVRDGEGSALERIPRGERYLVSIILATAFVSEQHRHCKVHLFNVNPTVNSSIGLSFGWACCSQE